MKKLILLAAIFYACLHVNAQSKCDWADVSWAPKFDNPQNGHYITTVDFNEKIVLSCWMESTILHFFQLNVEEPNETAKSIDIIHSQKEGRWYFEGIYRLGNQLIVLSKIKPDEERKFYHFIQSINPISGEFESEPILISEMTFLKSREREIKSISVSSDYSKLYFGHNNSTSDLKTFWHEAYIIDVSLDISEQPRVELKSGKPLIFVDTKFANNGDVLILSKVDLDKSERIKSKSKFYHSVVAVRNGDISKYKLLLHGNFISGINLSFQSDGRIALGGFYGENSKEITSGVFYVSEGEDRKSLSPPKYKKFSIEEITKYVDSKEEEKLKKQHSKGKKVDSKTYITKSFHSDEHGSFLLGEKYWISYTEGYRTKANGEVEKIKYRYYNYADIMLVKFDGEGNVEWIARIPRHHSSQLDKEALGSFLAEYSEDFIYIVYNDNLANHTSLDPKNVQTTPESGLSSITAIARVNKGGDGDVEKSYLFNHSESKGPIYIKQSQSMRVANPRFLLMGYSWLNYRFAFIQVE